MEFPIKFNDFPNELLLQILSNIPDPESLLQLTLTCRELHLLFHLEYLSQCVPHTQLYSNILEGKLHIPAIAWETDANGLAPVAPFLKGLRTSLTIRSLKEIVWEFTTPESQRPLWSQFQHLMRLLETLDTVEAITLDFRKVWFFGVRPSDVVLDEDEWGDSLLRIYELVSKMSCTSLTVYYAEFNKRRMGNVLVEESSWTWIRDFMIRPTIPLAFTEAYVKRLTDQSYSQLAASPLMQRAITLLNSSSLTTFIIESPYLDQRSWSAILSCAELPHLRTLSLNSSGPEFPFVDALRFLYRHPTLEELRLQITFPKLDRTNFLTVLPTDALPSLRRITAPEPFLHYIISQNDNILKRLEHITLFFFPLTHSELPTLGESLIPLTSVLANIEINLLIHLNSKFLSEDRLTAARARPHAGHPDWLRRCTRIEIITSHYGWDEEAMDLLPTWLSTFNPDLKEVIIRHRLRQASHAEDSTLRSKIWKECPQIDISIRDERSTAPQVKDMNALCGPYIHSL